MNTAGTITRRTQKASDSLFESLRHMYCKKDLKNALCRVWEEAAKLYSGSGSADILSRELPDSKNAEYGVLHMMLKTVGIAHEDGRELGYYYELIEKSELPDGDKYYKSIMEALYKNYRSYPSPEAFMKRIVSELACEGNRNDEESVRLRILRQFIIAGNYLSGWYGGKAVIESYAKKKTGAKKLSPIQVSEAIDESIFDDMDRIMREELEAKAKSLGKAPDKYRKRTVEDKYELIKICEDLAFGRFKAQGGTKKAMYLFAMAFDMTYYSGEPDEIFRPESDIEKNLFDDYYTNSFFRFLDGDYSDRDKKAGLDLRFTGEGINYKNFAEMVFIYCIASDMTPAEKIKKARELIDELKGSGTEEHSENGTIFYRNIFTGEIIGMDEEEFKRFIRENYDCGKKNGNPLTLCSAKNSAYANYRAVLEELRDNVDYYRIISAENSSVSARIADFALDCKKNTAAAAVGFFRKLSDAAAEAELDDIEAQEKLVAAVKAAKNECLKGTGRKNKTCLNDFLNGAEHDTVSRCDKAVSDMWAVKKAYDPADEKAVVSMLEKYVSDIRSGAVKAVAESVGGLAKNPAVSEMCGKAKVTEFLNGRFTPMKKVTEELAAAVAGTFEDSGITRRDTAAFLPDDMGFDSCNTGLWFFDPAPESVAKLKKEHSGDDWKDYIDLLSAINSFIGYTREETSGSDRTKPLKHLIEALDCDKDSVSRAYMVTAFYYRYILQTERETEDSIYIKGESFENIFEEMKEQLDVYLAASYYPLFSGRNIFDVCIALSAYSYITQ